MEDWVHRALARWPNVPALYGWLGLDRRGRWRIQGEVIGRHQIIDTIRRNYAADERGCWYFQNGPQRGYVELEYTPLVLRTDGGDRLVAHTGDVVTAPHAAYLDEHGALVIDTGFGAGVIDDSDLEWALARLQGEHGPVTEREIEAALALPSGAITGLRFGYASAVLEVRRLDGAQMPERLGFVREPRP